MLIRYAHCIHGGIGHFAIITRMNGFQTDFKHGSKNFKIFICPKNAFYMYNI